MNYNIYSVSDKAIYDALCQSTVTKSHIVELFLSRGVIVNPNTDRKKLAKLFSQRFHDFQDYLLLADIFSVKAKKERSCIKILRNQNLSNEVLFEILNDLNSIIKDVDDAQSSLLKNGSGYHVNVHYKQINFNRSEFRQVDDRTGVMDVDKYDGGYSIRMPHNQTFSKIFEKIIASINSNENIEDSVDVEEVNLTGVRNPVLRSKFFKMLIENMPDMEMVNVSGVYVFNPAAKSSEAVEDADDDLGDEDLIDSNDVDVTAGHIQKATLTGSKVLNTSELVELNDKGFYIFKITWTCKFSGIDSDLYEFEAQFSNPEDFTSFSYKLKGQYDYKEQGLHSSIRSKLDSAYTETFFLGKVEQAAILSINTIESEANGAQEITQEEFSECD